MTPKNIPVVAATMEAELHWEILLIQRETFGGLLIIIQKSLMRLLRRQIDNFFMFPKLIPS